MRNWHCSTHLHTHCTSTTRRRGSPHGSVAEAILSDGRVWSPANHAPRHRKVVATLLRRISRCHNTTTTPSSSSSFSRSFSLFFFAKEKVAEEERRGFGWDGFLFAARAGQCDPYCTRMSVASLPCLTKTIIPFRRTPRILKKVHPLCSLTKVVLTLFVIVMTPSVPIYIRID